MKAGPNHRSAPKGLDLHETPPQAIAALLRREQLPARLWDPCAGPGAIVQAIKDSGRVCFGSDIKKHRNYGQLDFFRAKGVPVDVDAIIMNPPYRLAAPFIDHALQMTPQIYALLRLNWYAAVRPRYPELYHRLARIHCFAPRLPLMHRANWKGPFATSQFDMAWFIWEATPPVYGTVIDKVNWRKL